MSFFRLVDNKAHRPVHHHVAGWRTKCGRWRERVFASRWAEKVTCKICLMVLG